MDRESCQWFFTRDDEELCFYAMPDSVYTCKFQGDCSKCTKIDASIESPKLSDVFRP